LGNKITEKNTKTLTHTLWSLLNLLPAGNKQRPHKYVPSVTVLFQLTRFTVTVGS
jgi:hypothetical protein